MIYTLIDACEYVLKVQGEAQNCFWLASLCDELKLWKTDESKVRAALTRDIKKFGESSQFIMVGNDEFALREWQKTD